MFKRLKNQLKKRFHAETIRLLSNSTWVFVSNILKAGLLFFKALVLTRFLGVSDYGDYLSVVGFALIVQAFFNLNAGTAVIRYGALFQSENKTRELHSLMNLAYLTAFGTQILATICTGICLLLFRMMLSKELDQEWPILIYAFALGLVFSEYVSDSYLRLNYLFKFAALLTLINAVLDVGLTCLLVYNFSHDFGQFIFGMAMIKIACSLVYQSLIFIRIRQLNLGFGWVSPNLIRDQFTLLFQFISANYGSRLLKNLIEQGDVLVIGFFAPQYQVGLYGVGKRIGYAILTVTDPLMQAVFPQLSHLIAQRDYVNLKSMLLQFSRLIFPPLILIFFLCYYFRLELVTSLFGAEFSEAADTFILVLAAAMLASMTFWNNPLLINLGQVRFRFLMNLVILIGSLVLSPLLIPEWGATGAAIILLFIKGTEAIWGVQRCLVSLNKFI